MFIILFCNVVAAQNDKNNANIWYFGDRAGVDFNSSSPIALTDGQLDTQEGVATICDQNGSLLFYTDGTTVWDQTHNTMPNGNGTLLGHYSSTQSAIIVPSLADTMHYYIFTVDELAGSNGLRYSKINMTFPGNGTVLNPLGDIDTEEKNILLITPVVEKITAVIHAYENSYWVIAHGWDNNNFYTYHITDSGVNPDPVISSIGDIHSGDLLNTVGYMKASPNGNKIAVVNRTTNKINLFNFNRLSGIIYNEVNIAPLDPLIYGIEFSVDEQFLFIGGEYNVSKYNLNDSTHINLTIDDMSVFNGTNIAVRALQLGPDGKIYVTIRDHDHLSVIDSLYQTVITDGIFLDIDYTGRNCRFGLPNLFYYRGWDPDKITNVSDSDNIIIYPNPVYDYIKVKVIKASTIILRDVFGCLILKKDIKKGSNTINCTNMPNGIYFLEIYDANLNLYRSEKIIIL